MTGMPDRRVQAALRRVLLEEQGGTVSRPPKISCAHAMSVIISICPHAVMPHVTTFYSTFSFSPRTGMRFTKPNELWCHSAPFNVFWSSPSLSRPYPELDSFRFSCLCQLTRGGLQHCVALTSPATTCQHPELAALGHAAVESAC